MIILDASTKKLQCVQAAAVTTTAPSFYVAYVDGTTTTYTPGEQHGALNGTSDVDVVDAPAASTQRQIKSILVVNRDSVTQTITVNLNVSAAKTVLWTATLATGEKLQFADGEGWATFDSLGNRKTIATTSSQMPNILALAGYSP